jgi:hypothetical protein
MVTLAYHAPYPGLHDCDEPWLMQLGGKSGGLFGLPSVDMLIIIIMV